MMGFFASLLGALAKSLLDATQVSTTPRATQRATPKAPSVNTAPPAPPVSPAPSPPPAAQPLRPEAVTTVPPPQSILFAEPPSDALREAVMPLLVQYRAVYAGWGPIELNRAITTTTWTEADGTDYLGMNTLFAEITPAAVWKATAWERIGRTFERMRRPDLATDAYIQAVGHNPRHREAGDALDRLGVKRGPRAHPAYAEEVHHLAEVVKSIDAALGGSSGSSSASAGVDRWANAALDRMRQQRTALLERARSEPYFGRIDLRRNTANESYYIGKFAAPGITDWRAPVATLIYEGTGGETTYLAPEGRVSVFLKLIRNFTIENARLMDMVDSLTEDTIRRSLAGGRTEWADDFLIQQLERSAGENLKDIVATIQREQNRVIRAPLEQAVVVQGVAGSGKTTVALHRVAYLLYTYPDLIRADQVLVVAPNKLFLQYVERLLPDLGVDGVTQTTFTDWALALLQPHVLLRTEQVGRGQGWLTAVALRERLDSWLYRFAAHLLPGGDVRLSDGLTISAAEIERWYMNELAAWPVAVRLERIRTRLEGRAAAEVARQQKAIEQAYEQRMAPLRREPDSLERRAAMQQVSAERDQALEGAQSAVYRALAQYLAGLPGADLWLRAWAEFLAAPDGAAAIMPAEERPFGAEAQRVRSGSITQAELPALVYVRDWLCGVTDKERHDLVVVDEAQDLGPLHYAVLAGRNRRGAFTVVGDLAQAIQTGAESWAQVVGTSLGEVPAAYTFVKSYRSTRQIVGLGRRVLERSGLSLPLPDPVLRSGREPFLQGYASESELTVALTVRLRDMMSRHKRVAILVATPARAVAVQQTLRDWEIPVTAVTREQSTAAQGPVVLPVTLAKGLEFDAVIVLDADREHYPNTPLGARRLYVAVTRPLHELAVFWTGAVSSLLEGDQDIVPKATF